jgi:light-regulated signal transduction histidine kinase (bacteriophytochrome)
MSRASLRQTLLGGMLLLTALALAIAGVTSIVALHGYLLTRTDDQLRAATAFAQQRIGQLRSFSEQGGMLQAAVAPLRVHTAPDTPVHVKLTESDRLASIEVTDGGPGMTAELAARARDRFARGDDSRSRGGSGLGLAIVAEIVAAHGGRMTLRSAPGEGTTVSLKIPMRDS